MESLKIGQIVSISTLIDQQQHYVCSSGFTNRQVFVRDSKKLEGTEEYRNSLFLVLPSGNFEMHDEQMKMSSLGQEEVKAYQNRLETEKNLFQTNIESQRGNAVTFGSQIVFKHIDSESYLSGCFECSQGGTGGFKIILTQNLSSQIIFKIQSYQSFLKQGDNVFMKSPIYIFNPKTKCYLATENTSVITFSQKSCVWSFDLSSQLNLVYLQHTRVNGLLTVVNGNLRILAPKDGYFIYDAIWVDQGQKLTRLGQQLHVKKRIRNYVDVSIEADGMIDENDEYRIWSVSHVTSLQDCFQIINIDKIIHRDILFILSTKESLNQFIEQMESCLNYNKMTFLCGLVTKIAQFLTDGTYNKSKDDYQVATRRQFLMRDLGSLNQIIKAIDKMYSFIVGGFLDGKKMEQQLEHQLFHLLYKCVEICCFENERLKIFMTPHLRMVFVHCLNMPSLTDIIPRVTSSLPPHLELADFDKQHDNNPLLLNFLSLLSKNTKNHPQIYKKLHERWSVGQWVDLKDKRWRYSQGSPEEQAYLQAWILLCSHICSNRNLSAQKIVQKYFSLKNLMQLIRHQHTKNKSILRRLVALLNHCYVNTIQFNPVILDRLCQYTNLSQPKADFMKIKKVVADQATSFILQYLKQQIYDPSNTMQSENLLQVLNLLDMTIILGFWPIDQTLNKLLNKLMVILRTNDSKRNANKLTIKVKHYILKIINTVINFQNDIRVKALMYRFKQLYQSQPNLELSQWIQALNETLDRWHLIGSGDTQVKFCQTLVELSEYPSVSLLSSNLEIMRRIFSQKAEIYQSFEKIFVFKQTLEDRSPQLLRQIRQKFFILSNPELKFATLSNQHQYGTEIWSPNSMNKGLITHIWQLASWMKTGGNEKVDYQRIGQQEIFQFLNQRQVNIRKHQQILKSTQIHTLLIRFLKNMWQVPTGQLARKLMYVIYYYLTLLVWNSLQCKNEIVQYLSVVKRQLQFRVGAIDLMRQLFDNNPGLIYNHSLFQQIVVTVLNHLSKQQQLDYYSSKMLDMLRSTLYYNQKTIAQNQVFLLSKLQQYDSLLIFKTEDISMKTLILQYDASYSQCFQTLQLSMSPQLTYLVTVFNMMGILIEDDNKINLGKCTQIHPFYQLLKFSVFSKRCWPLKRNVRAYINKLYYSQEDYNGIMELIKIEDFDNMLYDLDYFISLSMKEDKLSHVRLKNPIRFVYVHTFVYLNFQEVLISLYHMFTNRQMMEYIQKHLIRSFGLGNFQTHLKFLRIIERLQFIKIQLFFDTKLIRTLINKIVAALEVALSVDGKHIEILYLSKVEHAGQCPTFKNIIEACKRGSIKQQFMNRTVVDIRNNSTPLSFEFLKNLGSLKTLNSISVKKEQGQKVKISPALLKIFRGLFIKKQQDTKQFSFNEVVRKFNMSMKQQLTQQLQIKFTIKRHCDVGCGSYCDKCLWIFFQSQGLHDQKVDRFVEYVKVLIRENCKNPQYFSTDLKMFLFRMVHALIYSKKKEEKVQQEDDSGMTYWEIEKQTQSDSKLKNVQKFLKQCGTPQFICSTIINCQLQSQLQLAYQLFRMIIAFLMDGNTYCQDALLEQMEKSENNKVMRKINDLIVFLSRKMIDDYKTSKTESKKDSEFRVTTSDTYDYFDSRENRMIRKNVFQPDTDKEIKEKDYILKIFNHVYEFLHLLCQNNNVKAKKFIKNQGNPRNTVNLLQTAVVILRKMLKIINPKLVQMPVQLLQFINETTQLPCIQNQIFIAKSTLFQDMSTMEQQLSTLLQSQSEEQRQLFRDQEYADKIQVIYEQFIKILTSITQGNSPAIYNQFNKLQSVFFVRVTFTYLKRLGVSLKDPMDIFELEEGGPIKELALLIQKPGAKETVHKILQIQILSKKIQNHDSQILRDFIKFFNSPYFKPLPQLIQIQIESQQQFFSLEGSLCQETKTRLIQEAPRTTQRQKIVFLMSQQYNVFNELQFKKQQSYEDKFKLASQIVAIVINVIICLRDIDLFEGEVELMLHKGFAVFVFDLLKYGHFLLGLAYIYSRIQSDRQYLLERYKKLEGKPIPKNWIVRTLLLLKLVWHSQKSNDMIFTLISSAIAFHRPTLYSIHVFTMFNRIQSLESVFEAINKNIQPLTVVGVFGIAFFYIFSLVSLRVYAPTMYGSWNQDICTSWIDCILDLYISGTINSSSLDFQTGRFMLDLVYFIFFGLLFGNIISGLMTDTFKQLRSQQDLITFDEDNSCYICGINRETLQRNGEILNQSYRTVANKDMSIHDDRHNRFNYLYYIYMLRTKDQSDYTGLEYQVMNKVKNQDFSWLPSYERDQEKESQENAPDIKVQTDQILQLVNKIEQLPRKPATGRSGILELNQ